MLSFYPGPSKVYPQSLNFIQDAYEQGIVSINHRSERFEELLKETLESLHKKWNIPLDYTIYFISSATEAWEIVAQSLVKSSSMHLYNGAFGKKWSFYTSQIVKNAQERSFDLEESLSDFMLRSPQNLLENIDTLCLVQSETSNGTGQKIQRKDFIGSEDLIIAVDATSSMGGIELDWLEADVWLASVQKCMGIPAGLGVLICSPQALKRAEILHKKDHYNSILLMEENRKLYQTHYTPNVLGIYLLNRLSQTLPKIEEVDKQTKIKMQIWENFWKNEQKFNFEFLVKNTELRLPTVLALNGTPKKIEEIQNICKKENIELGKGYGEWKNNSIRIANFPSHTLKDIETLIQLLTQ
jgi:phosphoserine aminotransferase